MNEIFTTNDAREYFKSKGLTYTAITKDKYQILRDLVDEELKKVSGNAIDMKLNKDINRTKPTFCDNELVNGFIEVRGSYFRKREGISFNRDGFIGFAGWSGSTNVQPFIRAFTRWCDKLLEKKEGNKSK